MTTDISVCVGTFGDQQVWGQLAMHRALASVRRQTQEPAGATWAHAKSLHEARNQAAAEVREGWLCFLDADDELDQGYLGAMQAAITANALRDDWLLQPATLGVYSDGREDDQAVLIPERRLIDGNFMVIGTLIRAEQFHRLGGFREWPCYEDWDLWLRAWIDGARTLAVAEAIYRVFVSPTSRNNGERSMQVSTYHAIRGQHMHEARRRERARWAST